MKTNMLFNLTFLAIIALLSCSKDEAIKKTHLELAIEDYENLKSDPAFIEFSIPQDNPGPPFYARIAILGADRLFMEAGSTVIIPMLRNVDCINPEFNLLNLFDVPAAFFCPLTVNGKGLIEPGATPDVFPIIAYLQSSDMPIWFLDRDPLLAAIADGVLTLSELNALNPRKGVASRYIEYNKPRTVEDHLLVIECNGVIPATNQSFEFKVNSITKALQNVELTIK
jgi:hypothetical protein